MSTRVIPNTPTQVQLPGAEINLELADLNAHIAAELAAGLSDAKAIRERYQISEEQWAVLAKNRTFRKMLAEAVQSLGGDLNAGVRITKKAEIVLEDAIPVLDRIIHNETVLTQGRIDAIKELRALTGRDKKDTQGLPTGSGGFTLNINFGEGKRGITIDGKAVPILETVDE